MYDALAVYYDRLMSEVPYDEWADFVASKLPDGDGIDLGCGTGTFTLALAKRGRKVVGVDSSADMLRIACEKALTAGQRVPFVCDDMTTFMPGKPVAFVTCVCDGVNYIAQPRVVFEQVYKMLLDGGTFVFDVSSAYKLQHTIGANTFSYDDGELYYVWQNTPKKTYIDMDLTFFAQEGQLCRRSDEHQRQYIHRTETLQTALREVGFAEVHMFAGYTETPVRANTERILYIARKSNG